MWKARNLGWALLLPSCDSLLQSQNTHICMRRRCGARTSKKNSNEGRSRAMHSHISNHLHCIFSTKERLNLIPESIRPRLWAYIGGIAKNVNARAIAVGGTSNHLHLLLSMPSTVTVAEVIQKIKTNSSRWMREEAKVRAFGWQEGFGAFSVSISGVERTIAYIHNQAEHHKRRDFQSEWKEILRRHGIEVPSLRES